MSTDATPSMLLALPAELRLEIYTQALAPTGNLYLTTTGFKRHATRPSISPLPLLQLCRQIHREAAAILYNENTIHLLLDAHSSSWPIISPSRMPHNVLEKLVKLEILLDCTSGAWAAPSRVYQNVEFAPLGALGGLKELRIRVLAPVKPCGWLEGIEGVEDWAKEAWPWLAKEVLERISTSTVVTYGPPERETAALLEGEEDLPNGTFPMVSLNRARKQSTGRNVEEVSGKTLEGVLATAFQDEELADFRIQRGVKAGAVADVWGEWRDWERHLRGRTIDQRY